MTKRTMLLVIAIATAHGLGAQAVSGPRVGLSNSGPARLDASRPLLTQHGGVRPNHWARGAIIGGLIGAAIGVFFYNAFENETHGTIYIGVWALGGALVGGLIGSGSRKT